MSFHLSKTNTHPVVLVNPKGSGLSSTPLNHECASNVNTVTSGEKKKKKEISQAEEVHHTLGSP